MFNGATVGIGGGLVAGAESGAESGDGPCIMVVGIAASLVNKAEGVDVSILRGSGGSAKEESRRLRTPTDFATANPGWRAFRGGGGGGPAGGGFAGGELKSSGSSSSGGTGGGNGGGVVGVSATVVKDVLVV
jgi:hypothetical protein